MNSKKKVIIVISIIVILLISGIVLWKCMEKGNSNIPATGHFFGVPDSVEDIDLIEIIYNNGKDYITITPSNPINFYTYDKKGKVIDNYVDMDSSSIIKYVYDNDLKYLKDENNIKNEKWSLRVESSGIHCLISSDKDESKWFKELLKELNVDINGYKSNNLDN